MVENGLVQIKCYFLIGLPSETDEDVKAILHLAKQIRHQILSHRKGQKGRWKVVLSVNPFVPKPATPFQWVAIGGGRGTEEEVKDHSDGDPRGEGDGDDLRPS